MLFALASCARRQALFVVLPNPDGSSGAVTIDNGQQSMLLDQPYAAGELRQPTIVGFDRGAQVAAPVAIDEAQVQQVFGTAIAARPTLPSHFRLYFLNDSEQMTPDSAGLYQSVFVDIKRRTIYEVEVVGHTDTTGELEHNQKLSLARAEAIRLRLVHDGLDAKSISVAGRGPLDLRVKTPPNVREPLNRRVEIIVR
jgi:outer membrane protein OmpA-like peptidoglycan-associated protein